MRTRTLVLLAVAVLAMHLAACGASIRSDGRPVTNPLDDRARTVRPTPRPPEPGSFLAEPQPAGRGGAADIEGASVRALGYLAEVLTVPVRNLRVDSILERPGVGGWRVLVRDAFGNPHTVDVSDAATSWLGETREEGVLVARDEGQRVLVVQAAGRPLTLQLPAAGNARAHGIAPGTPVAFAYDANPRGDGTLVLAWLEVRP